MKKLIRYLAKVSGVKKEIETNKQKEIAQKLLEHSTWFNSKERAMTGNALYLYGLLLQYDKSLDMSKLRATLDDFGNICLQLEENEPDLRKIIWGIKS